MVVLTIVIPSNGHTVYFDQPMPKPNYIRLLLCSLYNSWRNLKRRGEISSSNGPNKELTVRVLPPGHYTLESMAQELQNVFADQRVKLETEINAPVGAMVIYKQYVNKVKLDRDLSSLLDISQQLLFRTYVKRLTSPSTYFIDCDLVDKEQTLFNGNPQASWSALALKGKHLKTFATKRHNSVSCVKLLLANT